eukprot:m.244167 g.244167  ORF g.244167 m.244167 type:complete len:300 (-) comp29983_c0_seq1:41-940(-)
MPESMGIKDQIDGRKIKDFKQGEGCCEQEEECERARLVLGIVVSKQPANPEEKRENAERDTSNHIEPIVNARIKKFVDVKSVASECERGENKLMRDDVFSVLIIEEDKRKGGQQERPHHQGRGSIIEEFCERGVASMEDSCTKPRDATHNEEQLPYKPTHLPLPPRSHMSSKIPHAKQTRSRFLDPKERMECPAAIVLQRRDAELLVFQSDVHCTAHATHGELRVSLLHTNLNTLYKLGIPIPCGAMDKQGREKEKSKHSSIHLFFVLSSQAVSKTRISSNLERTEKEQACTQVSLGMH